MPFQPLDYALVGLTVLLAVMGLCRGFSGAFAFLVATALGSAVVAHGWVGFLSGIDSTWIRVVASVVAFVVVFGVVRILVKFIVGKLLAQPSDSVFGVALGLFCGGFLLWSLAENPSLRDSSWLAQEGNALVR